MRMNAGIVFGLVLLWMPLFAENSESSWKKSGALETASKHQEPQYVQSRGIHKLYHEQTLERKLKILFACNKHMKYDSDLIVTVYGSSVIVVGRVSQSEDLDIVKDVLQSRVPHLAQEFFITVSDRAVDPVSRSKDQLLKLKVRAELLRSCGWVAGQIRVVVYQQQVYLIGPVSQEVRNVITKLENISKNVTVINRN